MILWSWGNRTTQVFLGTLGVSSEQGCVCARQSAAQVCAVFWESVFNEILTPSCRT